MAAKGKRSGAGRTDSGERAGEKRPAGHKATSRAGGGKQADDSRGGELLNMAQAIEMLKTTRPTFYRWLRSGKLKGMKVGRQWRFYREDIERFLSGQEPRIGLPADIGPLLGDLGERIRKLGMTLPARNGGDDAMEAVRLMFCLALASGASDLHLAAQSDGVHLRVRIDGVLHPVAVYDGRLHAAIIDAWKAWTGCDRHQSQLPQDGRVMTEAPGSGEKVDVRTSFVPAFGGEVMTARLLSHGDIDFSMDRLGLPDRERRLLESYVDLPTGLIIVTAPTGCGKTTTLYTCLNRRVRPSLKVMSVEDPVEVSLDGVDQIQIRPKVGLTFSAAIRACLRSAVDIIMVGEIRDRESAELIAQTALTGHLVLTTLHTTDAVGGLMRLVEVGVAPFIIAESVRLVVGQRLLRRLCPSCSKPGTPEQDELDRAAELARTGGVDWSALGKDWRIATGCKECRFTGYRGRALLAEALEVTPEIGAALRRGAAHREVQTLAIGQGMITMGAHGVGMASRGETSLDEVIRVMARR